LTQIHPINPGELSICAPRVYVVEEGSAAYGFGSEVIATLVESGQRFEKVGRIASLPVPIPSARLLESQVLLGFEQIVDRVVGDFHE
jgi:pyruvate/2-oxoglutarate/acetoin dehydrogenase E1 component